ncbi:hypothetical protein KKH13_02330, partial [Patescibacteria group bacterium]|nr:hypothetical protein [Patescibacteria group bacterium]
MAQETFITRDAAALKEHFEVHCIPLYGSKAKVDGQGEIFIPRWPQGKLAISVVSKDDGHVDTAIRMTEHILAEAKGRETDQANMVLQRSQQLVDLFTEHKLSSIPEDVRRAFQTETEWLLGTVGLNPERVILKEKQKMIRWLDKASLGKDSLGRCNSLITMGALFASRGRAYRIQEKLYQWVMPKYAHILESLIFAKSADVELSDQVREELGRLSGIIYIRRPGFRDNAVGPTIGMVGSLTWLLGQTKVRPYRLQALAARSYLENISKS